MKKAHLFAFATTMVCFSSVLSVADPIGPKPDELKTVRGFQLSITAPSAEFQPGKTIDLDSSIKNVTAKRQTLGLFPEMRRYRFEVTTDKGEKIPLTRHGQNQYISSTPSSGQGPCDVEPGASYKDHLELSRLYDLSESGTYLVKIKFILDLPPALENRTKLTTDDYITVPSNVLRITVL